MKTIIYIYIYIYSLVESSIIANYISAYIKITNQVKCDANSCLPAHARWTQNGGGNLCTQRRLSLQSKVKINK